MITRLKHGSDLQYTLNSEGCTVEEVLGIDYKSTIKPTINSLINDVKKSSMANSEELLVLQMQSVQINDKIEVKKKHIAQVEHSIEQVSSFGFLLQNHYFAVFHFLVGKLKHILLL